MSNLSAGGVVYDERRKNPKFALRFRAYGQRRYVTLGSLADGWTRESAEVELQNVLADVRRGIWRPPHSQPPKKQAKDPTFHEFASQWVRANEGGWRPKTVVDYTWQLTNHLLPFFAEHRLSEITVREVDRYREAKLAERNLSATSINKTISRLVQILEVAFEYELVTFPNGRNPARGKRRRVKASKPAPVWLDRAEHLQALLHAAGGLDAMARRDRQHVPRRAILATLMFTGVRIGELVGLRWRDIDFEAGAISVTGEIRISESRVKTYAGIRRIDMLPVLRDELLRLKDARPLGGLKATRTVKPDALVFPTVTGHALSPANIRNRVLAPAVKRANELLAEAGEVPLPERLTPHKLRHTFASLLIALGVDVGSVMDQLGHADAGFTLRVYRHAMRRDQASRQALRVLVGLDEQLHQRAA